MTEAQKLSNAIFQSYLRGHRRGMLDAKQELLDLLYEDGSALSATLGKRVSEWCAEEEKYSMQMDGDVAVLELDYGVQRYQEGSKRNQKRKAGEDGLNRFAASVFLILGALFLLQLAIFFVQIQLL